MIADAPALLRALRERGLVEATDAATDDIGATTTPDRPWFIGLLLGASGWIAGLFVLGFVGVLFRPEQPASAALGGAVLLAAAWGLFRADREGAFVAQLALALSIAGQCLVVFALSAPQHRLGSIAASACALQVALALAMPNALHRSLSTLFAAIAWALTVRFVFLGDPGFDVGATRAAPPSFGAALAGWALAWLPLGAALWALIRTEPAWLARGWAPVLRPVLAGTIVGLAFATLASHPFDSWRWFGDAAAARPNGLALWPLLSAFGALGAAAAAFALRHRALLGACLLAALLHLSHFYYALGTTLLLKSLLMAAMGVAMLIGARALRDRSDS